MMSDTGWIRSRPNEVLEVIDQHVAEQRVMWFWFFDNHLVIFRARGTDTDVTFNNV